MRQKLNKAPHLASPHSGEEPLTALAFQRGCYFTSAYGYAKQRNHSTCGSINS